MPLLKISSDLLEDIFSYAEGDGIYKDAPLREMVHEYLEAADDYRLMNLFDTVHAVQSDEMTSFEQNQMHQKLLKPFSKEELALNIGDIGFLYGLVACWTELKAQGRV